MLCFQKKPCSSELLYRIVQHTREIDGMYGEIKDQSIGRSELFSVLPVPFVAAQCVVSFLLAKHCENIFIHLPTSSYLSCWAVPLHEEMHAIKDTIYIFDKAETQNYSIHFFPVFEDEQCQCDDTSES